MLNIHYRDRAREFQNKHISFRDHGVGKAEIRESCVCKGASSVESSLNFHRNADLTPRQGQDQA
jgi:hypothetical protein